MTAIEPGTRVNVKDADGALLPRIAGSAIEPGNTFNVVWVCKEEDWEAARAAGRQPEVMAWPADAVQVVEARVAA